MTKELNLIKTNGKPRQRLSNPDLRAVSTSTRKDKGVATSHAIKIMLLVEDEIKTELFDRQRKINLIDQEELIKPSKNPEKRKKASIMT